MGIHEQEITRIRFLTCLLHAPCRYWDRRVPRRSHHRIDFTVRENIHEFAQVHPCGCSDTLSQQAEQGSIRVVPKLSVVSDSSTARCFVSISPMTIPGHRTVSPPSGHAFTPRVSEDFSKKSCNDILHPSQRGFREPPSSER